MPSAVGDIFNHSGCRIESGMTSQHTRSSGVKQIAGAAVLFALAAAAPSGHGASADSYPSKSVRFIVAFPAGGNADLIGRLAAQRLTEGLGRPFVVDNRGGAGGVIA